MTEVSKVNCAQNQQPQTTKITIKKNQGITQALFDLVKQQKMEISDGKIDANEWSATMKKLNEIQSSREQAGQKGIYSGGEGTDWHKNYIVHEGDQLEFTEAEMNDLYSAMGVSLKKGEKPASPTAPTAPKAPAAPKNKKADNDGYRTTWRDGVYFNEKTRSHYTKDKDGNYVEMRGAEGGRIIKIHKDGSYIEKVESIAGAGDYTIYKVNAKGQKTGWIRYDKDGKKRIMGKYEYWPNGKKKTEKIFAYNEGQKYYDIFRYDENGKETGGQKSDGTKYTINYLPNGHEILHCKELDGTQYYEMWDAGSLNFVKCDKNGNKIEK